MSSDPYIPRADRFFREWAHAFVHGLHDCPEAYMLTSGQTIYLVQAFEEFEKAYELAIDNSTRTRTTIVRKQDARSILEGMCRDIAGMIRPNQGVSDEEKIAIGVRPRNIARQRRRCPQISPVLAFIGTLPGVDILHVSDPTRPRAAKPYHAARVQIWVANTPLSEPAPKIDQARFLGAYRRPRIYIDTDRADADRPATYWARYVGFRDDVGPWSLPTSNAIAARLAHQARQKKAESADADESGDASNDLKLAA
jgi:hypothetical protein